MKEFSAVCQWPLLSAVFGKVEVTSDAIAASVEIPESLTLQCRRHWLPLFIIVTVAVVQAARVHCWLILSSLKLVSLLLDLYPHNSLFLYLALSSKHIILIDWHHLVRFGSGDPPFEVFLDPASLFQLIRPFCPLQTWLIAWWLPQPWVSCWLDFQTWADWNFRHPLFGIGFASCEAYMVLFENSWRMRSRQLFHMIFIFSLEGNSSSPSRMGENCF